MFGSTLIIDRLTPSFRADDLRTKEEDKLVLGWEQRRWLRGRFTTAKGRKVGIALPTGTTLAPNSILWIGSDWYLRIEAAIEPVLEITPSDYEHGVRIAFEVGNRHFPLAMEKGKILVPDDNAMVRLMDRLDASWERRQMVFTPVGGSQHHQHE